MFDPGTLRRWLLPPLVAVVAGSATTPAPAGAELLLDDGRTLAGISVQRRDDVYLLTLGVDEIIAVPAPLVVEVRLTGDDAPAPTGFEVGEPRTLAGPPSGARLPARAQQLASFGPPATFRKGALDPVWQPRDGWLRPGVTDFSPARWAKSPLDPTWTPRSAFSASQDVTQFSPVRWARPPIDPTWWPTDGFRPASPQ